MAEEAISTVQGDLARDFYELAASEEITRLMHKFDAHDVNTSAKLDNYERWKQRAQLGPLTSSQPPLNPGNPSEEEDSSH